MAPGTPIIAPEDGRTDDGWDVEFGEGLSERGPWRTTHEIAWMWTAQAWSKQVQAFRRPLYNDSNAEIQTSTGQKDITSSDPSIET